MNTTRFVIAPCMGVGKIVANVTRRAAYLVHQKHPETTALLSLPALLAGDPEQRELVRNNPVILFDGCTERCGMHIFCQLGVWPIAKIEVAQIMAETKIGPGKTRQQLEDIGRKLSGALAARIEKVMQNDALLRDFKPAQELKLASPKPECAHACNCLPARRRASARPRKYVTIFPCQGIRRTGGRIAQRAAYILVEDRFPGKTLLLCVPALAAAVQEDVDMLEQFPTVAINGCGMRCASVNAAHYGVPPAASVDLDSVAPTFGGERQCMLPDLTEAEAQAAVKLADACCQAVQDLLAGKGKWRPGKADLLGVVNQPAKINEVAGFRKCDQGYMTRHG
ncbi:MAG: hypothetical protein NTW87_27240 [Planctomycetota bacterium]|nr:hypothetical protein [Planctomycetota bacterium]